MYSSATFAMGSNGKPVLQWSWDGQFYWWENHAMVPALCRQFFPNGGWYDFWLYPGMRSINYPNYVQTDCNYY